MNSTMGTVGALDFDPIFKVFNTVNQGVVKFVFTRVEFIEDTSGINGTVALMDLAKLAEKRKWEGPADLAKNHDKYFYDTWKTEKKNGK